MNNTVTQSDSRVGSVVGGRYRLTSRISEGGMAVVYRAVDEVLGRQVAVKLMHPALSGDEAFVERFRREAKNAANLSHPNIVTVHDWGREPGAVYMVMELVEGESLRDLLERAGSLTLDAVRHIVTAVAAALDHAHERGIVHRDVKPENVLLSWSADGPPAAVKLVDFGIARALAEQTRLTTDAVVGTMTYIAPEQLQDAEAGPRADVFALGVMVYELLSGRPAFDGDSPAAVAAARLTRSVPSPGVSPQVDGAIARATALRPDDRFSTAGELASTLHDAAAQTNELRTTVQTPSIQLPPIPTQLLPSPAPKRRRLRPRLGKPELPRRRRWPYLVTAVAVLASSAGVAYLTIPRTAQVPRLSGMPPDQARTALERAGLVAGRTKAVFHDVAEAGTVVGTIPADTTEVRRGTRITLEVSSGPEMLQIPDVTGKPLEEAQTLIAEAGLVPGDPAEEHSPSVPKGHVVRQDPSDGTARRNSAVALVVSKGPELVAVPDVKGKTAEEAKAALTAAGLTAATATDFSDQVAEGRAIASNPPAGRHAEKGSTVTVVISKGPKPFPMPDLRGMDIGAARDKANSLELVVSSQTAVPNSGQPKGRVIGQKPDPGAEVRRGAGVQLFYAA